MGVIIEEFNMVTYEDLFFYIAITVAVVVFINVGVKIGLFRDAWSCVKHDIFRIKR